jgi:predicted TPR repeat methyltransferase
MSDSDFSATVERFTGFGSHYDNVRPSAPTALADLLLPLAKCEGKASLVVDLGCGTGLSTRYWMPFAESVVGVEPTDSMREQAETVGGQNISYRKGFSHATGLEDRCADIVVCAQAQIDRLREVAHRAFGSNFTRWFWSARVRIGVV